MQLRTNGIVNVEGQFLESIPLFLSILEAHGLLSAPTSPFIILEVGWEDSVTILLGHSIARSRRVAQYANLGQ